jgi:CDP-diacylglycerol---serine O-phosphatidyltransferase
MKARDGQRRRLYRLRGDRDRPRQITHLSINRMIPNMLTLAALCAGMTAIRFAIGGKWEASVEAVIIAALLDGLDGRVARLLNSTSTFGAQLDSLSDFLSFGVAPGFILYMWSMSEVRSLGWAVALMFAACSALRLARFNTQLTVADPPPYAAKFFTGVPAPAAAGLALMPMVASFELGPVPFHWPWLVILSTILIGFMMVSRVPTYSFKKVRIQQEYVAALMAIVALLAAFMTTEPWATLLILGIAYVISLPLSIRAYRAYQKAAESEPAQSGPPVLRAVDSNR